MRFGYWQSYWNKSVILPCDIPEACLGEPDPTYLWYRDVKGDYAKREDVMYFRVPLRSDAKKNPVYGQSFCTNSLDSRDYNCSHYRYGVSWMKDEEIGNVSGSFVDLALRKNTGTRCNVEAGYTDLCSSLIEAKDLNADGTLINPARQVQCRRCTRCLQNGTNNRFARGNWIKNDCVKCAEKATSDSVNPSLISLFGLFAGFILMSTWTLSHNTSNHRGANYFVMAKAKSKFMSKMLAKRKAAAAASDGSGGGRKSANPFGTKRTGIGGGASKTAIVPVAINNTRSRASKKKLTRIEKIKAKKAADKAKHDGSMGSKNEDHKVGSISMTKILMNHVHMMSMIPLFDSNFLTDINKTFFNSVGSIFGLYTGSAFECYFDYSETFPLAQKRAMMFMLSPLMVMFCVGVLWLPLHFCQDHTKMYYGSFWTKCVALSVTVFDMLYPVLTLETLKLLPCTTVYRAENECDSRRFMMIDLDIECGRDIRHATILYGFGLPMLWLFVLGIPAMVLLQVFWHRKNLNSKKTHIRFNAIMAGFKLNKKWWTVVVMARKASFIAAAIMLKILVHFFKFSVVHLFFVFLHIYIF